ncbi:MAG: hypothetical protein OEM26_01715 [Saprospiraceae bacterium]|nr:hypothetical protein [Saprospiraceae bacterium]
MSKNTRRNFVGQSAGALFGLSSVAWWNPKRSNRYTFSDPVVSSEFPSHNPEDVRAIVGASHTRFEEVKEMVSARPELAKAAWDWGFGDWESALGAASHMGRRDIAEVLIEHGARPNIYTFAMLGNVEAVKAMVESMPGVQRIHGPHGFTLMHHAQIRLRYDDATELEKENANTLTDYLSSLGDADIRAVSLDITEEEQKAYMGQFTFGTLDDEVFTVELNSRGMLYMSRGDKIGRVLNRVDQHIFSPGGAASVRIHFEVQDGQAVSLTIHDPVPLVTATRREG